MAEKLTGIVEADETYVGGKNTGTLGGPMAGGSKIIVFTLVQRDGEARPSASRKRWMRCFKHQSVCRNSKEKS
jgi:hypothetical protein